MDYDTRQKRDIDRFFQENKERAFSTEEIARLLPDIAQSTLYRILGKLIKEGRIRKCPSSSRLIQYQYIDKEHCPNHMHIKCVRCGRIEHISEDDSARIEKLIKSDLGFDVSNTSTLEGLCKECSRK